MTRTLERLCSLPLFMGISRTDMEEIISKVRFNFQKYPKSKTICDVHHINNHIYFLLEGDVEVSRHSNNNAIQFMETLHAPAIIGADVLFGISHAFTHCYKAKTDTQFMILDKKEINEQLLHYDIFRLNLLNHLSLLEQKRLRMLHESLKDDLSQRFIQYLKHNFTTLAGPKLLKCRQKDLGTELLTHEKNICRMLRTLEQRGLLTTGRSQIYIPALQNLIEQ